MLQIHLDILVFILLDFSAAFNIVGGRGSYFPKLAAIMTHALASFSSVTMPFPCEVIESASLAFGSGCAWVLV